MLFRGGILNLWPRQQAMTAFPGTRPYVFYTRLAWRGEGDAEQDADEGGESPCFHPGRQSTQSQTSV